MKQTAVEWLHEKLTSTWFDVKSSKEILEIAKEKEKEQIKQAYLDSSRQTCDSYGDNPPHDDPKFAELYYKQTYGDK
jgi:hypothetical protein